MSVHKVRFAKGGDASAWRAFVDAWRHPASYRGLPVTAPSVAPTTQLDSEIDVPAFHSAWDAMRDTHEFFGLLRRHGLQRQQAFRLAGRERARRTPCTSLEVVLRAAAVAGEKVMIFAGNHGMLQIHIGVLERIVRTPGWLNVMDPGVNVHVDEAGLVSAWVVCKPTEDGRVLSLELFNAQEECVVMLFAKRAEGHPEPAWWRELLRALPDASDA
jgi:putative hemin transport protein